MTVWLFNKLKKRTLIVLGCVLTAGLLFAYVTVSLWIGSDVKAVAREAMRQYEGDRVEALIQYVDDPSHSLRERNRAAWALGQLGDPWALPTIKRYYTGQPCDHSSALCQHELGKALDLLEGGLNVTAFVWR